MFITNCTAIILAGGLSSRMGQDKANLHLGDKTLLQTVIDTLLPLFNEVKLSVRSPRENISLVQIVDEQQNAGPLAGLVTCLQQVDTPWVFVVACDMPFIHPALIQTLASYRAQQHAVVPVVQGHVQPLAGFYARDCLPILQAKLASQQRGLTRALNELDVCYVPESALIDSDPQLRSFFDLDTPQDWLLAQQ